MVENRSFKNVFDEMRKQYMFGLAQSSVDYLKNGLNLFHERRTSNYLHFQVALGNLSIAIELMIKAFLAKKNIAHILIGIQSEMLTCLINPEDVPNNYKWENYMVDIRNYNVKTIDFQGCVTKLFVYFPQLKQKLNSYLRMISHIRNSSVHAVFPFYQRYELERTAYAAIYIFKTLENEEIFRHTSYALYKNDDEFYENFGEERVNRVKAKIEKAKEIAKQKGTVDYNLSSQDWECYIIVCPICDHDALLYGFTEYQVDSSYDERGEVHEYLNFLSDSFRCEICGLTLDDSEELKLAAIDTDIDRTDDLDIWHEEILENYQDI